MKVVAFLLLFCLLYASDEAQIEEDITKTQSIDELTTKMQYAPRQYRHRYIQAIKERVMQENQAKRQQLMQSLSNEDVATQHINALSGNRQGSSASGNGGCGCGGGKGGHGGKGGGNR